MKDQTDLLTREANERRAKALNKLDAVLPRLAEIQGEMTARVDFRVEEDGRRFWYVPSINLSEGNICDFRTALFDKSELLDAAAVAAPDKTSELSEALTLVEQLSHDITVIEDQGKSFGGALPIENDLADPVYARVNANLNRFTEMSVIWQLTPYHRNMTAAVAN